MPYREKNLELTIADLLMGQGFNPTLGSTISRNDDSEVLIEDDLREYLRKHYQADYITENEISAVILKLRNISTGALYDSNRQFCSWLADGFIIKREDTKQKDILINLLDYRPLDDGADDNIYRFVTQLEIQGDEKRIPDGILYVNGLPLVVFEFKSAIRENATIYDAFIQLSIRYRRDIPQLFAYNAFCVISDGVNNKTGSFFAPYDKYYAWRRISLEHKEVEGGIDSLYTMLQGLFDKRHLLDVFKNFLYFPDSSKKELKVLCRYPQYYAARALYNNILGARRPNGDGKGGTYFGATGCGKSYTMLFLSRLLMRSPLLGSPTIILITDRTDLDDQLSSLFVASKKFIGDEIVQTVESREDLRNKLLARKSGGVFLTTIQKFSEDLDLLTDRTNVICISDEAHRTQTNLDQKVKITDDGVQTSYGFARYLHDSLPNAVYVGFTGTPIDATLDVFGPEVDIYTMTESVKDGITVPIIYEGRAAKILVDNKVLNEIEAYYDKAAEQGANEYQIETSKKEMARLNAILGHPDRLQAIADDFVKHYESRIAERASVNGKALFVCSNRKIAYDLFKNLITLRPEWNVKSISDGLGEISDREKRELVAIERVKMVMTRNKDDPKELYDLLGDKDDRKVLDRLFKEERSNFKIGIVVDMWLTGFDVPCLDAIYIDKPIKEHSLIQTISRVNRTYNGKEKGIVVDYIGIKKKMNQALGKYGAGSERNVQDIEFAHIEFLNHLDLLGKLFHGFDTSSYFSGTDFEKLETLKLAAEYIQRTKDIETRFMGLTKRLKAAFNVCVGLETITEKQRETAHFYFAIRSIIYKLTHGDAPDTAQMNERVSQLIEAALASDGVEEVFKLGVGQDNCQNIFDDTYLEHIQRIKLPNTKIKLLQRLLQQSIEQLKKVNKIKGVDFTKKLTSLVDSYNNRTENDILRSEVFEEMAETLTNMIIEVKNEFFAGDSLGISFEEKAFYDILKHLCVKYQFTYPEDKLLKLSKEVKKLVEEQSTFPDWNTREDIKSALKVGLILLLDEFDYPPVERDEVYDEIFEQAENF